MNTNYFLGANTASGFVSRFDQLHTDRRIKKLIILKGGPGCGKSTFMKKLRKTAADLGADTESCPCSSDPSSLDALLIPAAGLAVVDGTAPHAGATKMARRITQRAGNRPPGEKAHAAARRSDHSSSCDGVRRRLFRLQMEL